MIEKIGPTIYKGESIYKTGGGGGVSPEPDPTLYKKYQCIKATTNDSPDISGTNFIISDGDLIKSLIYFYDGYLELYTTNKRLCGLQKVSSVTLQLYGFGGNEYIDAGNVPGYFIIRSIQNKYKVNGVEKTVGSILTGNARLQWIFKSPPVNTEFFYLSIYNGEDKEKYKFIPCLRLQDNKKGLLELYTNSFLVCPNSWELMGEE